MKKKVTEGVEEMKPSSVDVFHGLFLDDVVDKAVTKCPVGYYISDLDVRYLNNEWVVIAKIEKNSKLGRV